MSTTRRFWILLASAGLAASCGGGGGGGAGHGGSANLADLVVDLVAFDPPSATAGTSLSISDTVSNTGLQAATAFRVGLYLSSDATITSTDRLLGFRTINSLAPGASSGGGGSLTLPASTSAGTYWIGALADDAQAVSERSELNNARAAALSIQIAAALLPDLEMTSVTTGQTSALAGDLIDVSDTVTNAGASAAGPFQVGIYLSNDATITAQDLLLGLRPVQSLAAGASSSASDALIVPPAISAGSWWLGALADPQGALAESDESDNARSAPLPIQISVPPRPNLVLQSFSFAPASVDSGTALDVSDRVANVGPGAAGSFDVSVYLSTDAVVTRDDTLLGTRTLAALASGASDASSGQVAIPLEIAGGTYWVGAIADAGLDLPETSETDNTLVASGALTITVPPRPDLAPSAVSFSPGSIDTTLSQVLHLSETVTNLGTADAGPLRIGLYLSSNNVITPSDILLASRTLTGLPMGASSGSATDVALPLGVSPGTYYVGVYVDDQQAALELHESNNALAASGTLDVIASPLPLPDLVMHSVSFTPHQVNPGGVIQVLSEVRNQGLLSATSFQVGLYLSTDDQIATDDLRIGQRSVLQLGINFGSAASAPLVVPASLPAGTYYLGAVADDLSQVVENQEQNNALRASGTLLVVIPPPPMPDLIVEAVSFTPTSAGTGQMLQLSANLRNQGDLAAGAFRVAFYVSVDATIDTQDTLLGFQSLSSLGPNQTFVGTISASVPAGLATGNFTLGAFVDDALVVSEGVETNNVRVASTLLHLN